MSPIEVFLLILVVPATLYQIAAGLRIHAAISYAGGVVVTRGLQYALALTVVIQVLFAIELFAW